MAVDRTSTSTILPAREDITFPSGKETIAAWLYPRPSNVAGEKSPAIVVAHGLGATKENGLDDFGRAFQEAGYTVIVFDYRYFGGSTGMPRQLLKIGSQLADWAAAIEYTRSLPTVDPSKVAIFGTSFGGGHAMTMAVRDPKLACAISQCPFTSGLASTGTVGLLTLPFIAARAISDQLLGLFTRRIVRITLAGEPGEVALMNKPDVVAGALALSGEESINYVGARIGLWLPLYFPGRTARKAEIPIFVAICGSDSVAPPGPTLSYAKKIPKGEWKVYEDMGHFSIYKGEAFKKAMADYLAFLGKHVPVATK
ncbi:hypothetical protein A4X13_0g6584 [Tilletia indica]|uniref:AB hydrolase-1 domain-containing protein n=1 Tax=Tilletia indica TaxID=43049 RepID=A0A177TDR0_9BASI|nr:hypothetical protein A4X13_0g6584 [Tilletia indica]